ncbi:MAG: ferric reductase-like transmembrane domain-containing protein [Chitinophagaceae bacterium]|nr:ferric reductase-like transmembrane domain-containing protein [Chitinophagaceae bacterium]
MFNISYLDISSSLGLCATGLLTLNFLLGILLSTGYKAQAFWKKLPEFIKGLPIERIHNWTAYLALSFALLHPFFLLLDKDAGFGFTTILLPLQAPKQPIIVLLGVLAFYALITVIISSQKPIKKKLGYSAWKNIHFISYGTALLFLIHGLLMDPLLKDRPTDWIDAEKVFSECCILLLLAASFYRYRYFVAKKNQG